MKRLHRGMILFFLVSISCSGSNINNYQKSRKMIYPVVTKEFEMLDFREYDSVKRNYSVTLKDNMHVQYMGYSGGYKVTIQPANSYFSITKLFDDRGYITEKGLLFNSGGFRKGVWYHFTNGQLSREDNADKAFPFSFEQLYDYLVKEKIPLASGHIEYGYQTQIRREVDEKGARWSVEWLKDHTRIPNLIETITIDGKTGKIIDKKYTNFSPSR